MIKNNPFKTLPALSFIIGAIIILIYFIKINYFPSNMSINDIIIILSLSCILGLIFIFMVTIILASPVFFYDLSEDLKKFEETIKLNETQHKNKPRQVKALVLYIPILILTILTISSILISDIIDINIIPLTAFLFILSFIIAICIFRINFNLVHQNVKLIEFFTTKITYTYMFFIFISLFLSFISITLSSFLLLQSESLADNKFFYFVYIVVFVFIFIFADILSKNFLYRIVFGLTALVSLLAITNSIHLIPYFMLKKLNLGQIYETIVLDKKACQIIDSKIDNDFCKLENIKLVWKFGDTYVFDKQNNPDSKSYIRYEIPKSSIIMTNKVFDYKRELNILKEKEENINKKIKNQVDKTEISKLEKDKTTITTKIKIIEEKARIKKLKQLISEREKLEQLISEREKLEREINEQ